MHPRPMIWGKGIPGPSGGGGSAAAAAGEVPGRVVVVAEHCTKDKSFLGAGGGSSGLRREMRCDICLPRSSELLTSSIQSMISSHVHEMIVPNFLLDQISFESSNRLSWACKRHVEEHPVDEVQPSRAKTGSEIRVMVFSATVASTGSPGCQGGH